MSRAYGSDTRFDDDKGRWVTTHEKKRRIHINENGVPDKGNPFVIAKMTGTKPKTSTGYKTKNLHSLSAKGKSEKVVKALKDLDDGATITLANGTQYTKVGSGFVSSKGKTGGKQTPQAIAKILGGHAQAGKDFTVDDPKPGAPIPNPGAQPSSKTGKPTDSKEVKKLKSYINDWKQGKTHSFDKEYEAIDSLKNGSEITFGGNTWKKTTADIGGQVMPVFSCDGGGTYTNGSDLLKSMWASTSSGGDIGVTEPDTPVDPNAPMEVVYKTGQLGVKHDKYMGDNPIYIPKGSPHEVITESGHKIVEAGNILSSCKSTTSTKEIIEKQGFSGLPRRVSKEEFQKIAKQSGFVSKRTYCAASQELADEYRKQLYEGDFYVDCSVGGAQYGQGMYCAADYTSGGYNAGIDAEMKHYQALNKARQADNAFILGCSTSDLNKAIDECKAAGAYGGYNNNGFKHLTPTEHEVLKKSVTHQVLTPEEESIRSSCYGFAALENMLSTSVGWSWGTTSSSKSKSATKNKFLESYKGYTKTEVVTLDPSAKIISYSALKKKYNAHKGSKPKDMGAFAAALGYDAINAHGHGQSGSYTVILNRTKCVFLDKPINGDSVDVAELKSGRIVFTPAGKGVFNAYRDGEYLGWVSTYIGR